jgi:hypothetical protein
VLHRTRPRVRLTDAALRRFAAACEDLADDDLTAAAVVK